MIQSQIWSFMSWEPEEQHKVPLSAGACDGCIKNGMVGQTFLPDVLRDVLVLWVEKGQIFLGPSTADVL